MSWSSHFSKGTLGLATSAVLGASLLLGHVAPAQAYDVPAYDGFVNDYADILSEEYELQLEQQLLTFSQATIGAEIAVVTITSLEDEPIELVGQDFFDEWKIGDAEADNGVLILTAIEDRRARVQTGYGIEPYITDTEAFRIIDDRIAPNFATGQYEQGITAAVTAVQDQVLAGEGFIDEGGSGESPGQTLIEGLTAGLGSMGLLTFVIYGASFLGRSKAWWPGGVIGLALGGLLVNLPVGIFFGVIGLLIDYMLSKNFQYRKKHGLPTSWSSSRGGFGGGSFSSSSSGSFGGGSSGGGGASGGW